MNEIETTFFGTGVNSLFQAFTHCPYPHRPAVSSRAHFWLCSPHYLKPCKTLTREMNPQREVGNFLMVWWNGGQAFKDCINFSKL